MKNIWAITEAVLKDTVRKRLFLAVLLFGAALLGLLPLIPSFKLGLRWQFLVDISLSLTSIFAVVLAVILSANQVRGEVDGRTIYNVLSKPVSRLQYLLGKYLGILIALALVLAVVGMEISLLVVFKFHVFKPQVFAGVLTVFLEASIIAAFCLSVSTFTTAPIAVFSTILFYLLCHDNVITGETVLGGTGGGLKVFAWGFEYLIPNLNKFNLADEIGYGAVLTLKGMMGLVGYAFLFVAVLLFIGYGVFRRYNL
ncbi:MAG: ABC transporter permease subunit [Actinobacteria bacterium]|nr:ABC transporter permease subunit [Actinomycetota bacterium]